MKRWLPCILVVLFLLPQFSAAEEPPSYDWEKLDAYTKHATEQYELKYGNYHLWNYNIYAQFAEEYGSVPGNSFSNEFLPTIPDDGYINESRAIELALMYLPEYQTENKVSDLQSKAVSTRFCIDPEGTSYLGRNGTWIIGFWKNTNELVELVGYIYIDAKTEDALFAFFSAEEAFLGAPADAKKLDGG